MSKKDNWDKNTKQQMEMAQNIKKHKPGQMTEEEKWENVGSFGSKLKGFLKLIFILAVLFILFLLFTDSMGITDFIKEIMKSV